jgi:hypothetical protein
LNLKTWEKMYMMRSISIPLPRCRRLWLCKNVVFNTLATRFQNKRLSKPKPCIGLPKCGRLMSTTFQIGMVNSVWSGGLDSLQMSDTYQGPNTRHEKWDDAKCWVSSTESMIHSTQYRCRFSPLSNMPVKNVTGFSAWAYTTWHNSRYWMQDRWSDQVQET